jgi:hypothetical protein
MDIEFHYHWTLLIAARAGFKPEEARTIAYASQYTDDNKHIRTIDEGKPSRYVNYISQTFDQMKPKPELYRVYLLFHFMPGDAQAPSARRRNGAMNYLNTTPGSQNVEWMMRRALESGDLFRIGIAAHVYADSWAHQNFTGYNSSFNMMPNNLLSKVIPYHIGHVWAGQDPDKMTLRWTDERLIRANEQVDNTERFLDAARSMFRMFATHRSWNRSVIEEEAALLVSDLAACLAGTDASEEGTKKRLLRYLALAGKPAYCDQPYPLYHKEEWFKKAVTNDQWKDRQGYQQTEWYRFQEAVQGHQKDGKEYLLERFKEQGIELPGF